MSHRVKTRRVVGVALALGCLLIPIVLVAGVWKTLLAVALTVGIVGGILLALTADADVEEEGDDEPES